MENDHLSIIQWALDTRPLWPSATETKDLNEAASREFSLLNEGERQTVLRYHFVKDAKLSLASALLKRLSITTLLADVSWEESSRWKRDEKTGKPTFDIPPSSCDTQNKKKVMRFNVSHQAGVVVLIASALTTEEEDEKILDVGIDVVCQSERRGRDLTSIASEGWSRYVAVHEDVFSPLEASSLRKLDSSSSDDTRLAYFYTLWCLREAYIKMTGEALLAPWLKDLEMRHFSPPPSPSSSSNQDSNNDDYPPLEIWFRGRPVQDVCMRLSSLLDDQYVVSTAVRCPPRLRARVEHQLALPFTQLVLDEMVAEAEEANRRRRQ
ncbi:hypothetical protein CP532_2043 [Ophiocordyceps camponoti-leonardi (nom. inval.)]|nr:hypothetical protein CP532_2043 [Ophiocordyceps camponoti-leonardi (nom. inval.)]